MGIILKIKYVKMSLYEKLYMNFSERTTSEKKLKNNRIYLLLKHFYNIIQNIFTLTIK